MSIITFWNDTRDQSGRTLTAVATATMMAIERNNKILLISTSVADSTMKKCFWAEENKNTSLFNTKSDMGFGVETGIEGLIKLLTSKKLIPSMITDYTKVVFKDRLELITAAIGSKNRSLEGNIEDFKRNQEYYTELIRVANEHYDYVIVDLDKMTTDKVKEEILKMSDVNVFVLSQRMESINRYRQLKNSNNDLIKKRCVPVIGKYISKYKYNSKNIARYLQDKKELDLLPLNLLYMEAAEEASVADLILKLKNVKDKTDENYIFMQCLLNLTNNILKRLQDMQMRMG